MWEATAHEEQDNGQQTKHRGDPTEQQQQPTGKPLAQGRLHTAERQPGCKQHGPNGVCPKWGAKSEEKLHQAKAMETRMQGGEASAGATTKVNIQVAKNKDGVALSDNRAQAQLQGCKSCKEVIHRSAVVGQMHTGDTQRFRERVTLQHKNECPT